MLSDIMLTGKAISRAVRGHMLVDAALNTILVAKAYHIPLPTKETDEPKQDTASTDPENDDVETDHQKQGTVDVTSDITEAKYIYDKAMLSTLSVEDVFSAGVLDLGIIVDADCLFKQHISHICRKAYFSINVILRCFHTANIAALIISYKSSVRPILEYSYTVWNPYIPARHYLGMTDQVEKVQRYFTRRVYQRCQLDCNHSYLQRLTYLKIESLELRSIYQDLAMVHKSIVV